MESEQEINIKLSLANINKIVNILSQAQYSQVYDLIDSIRNQAIMQLNPPARMNLSDEDNVQ